MRTTAKEKKSRQRQFSDMDEANYREMEKYCPPKARYTTRQPVAALEYQRMMDELKKAKGECE